MTTQMKIKSIDVEEMNSISSSPVLVPLYIGAHWESLGMPIDILDYGIQEGQVSLLTEFSRCEE